MAFAGAVVDLDGTVYHDGEPIDGALDGIDRLQSLPDGVLYVSNHPGHSSQQYVDRLAAIGIETQRDRILSSGIVTTEYLANAHSEDSVFVVGSAGLREQLQAAGIRCCDDPTVADVFLASWAPEFAYGDLVDALRAFEREIPFYGTDPDRTFPGSDGRPVPGSGSIIRAIAETTEREPDQIFGKPSERMIDAITNRLTNLTEEYLLIGDRIDTDIALGEQAGMTTVLVKTGSDKDTTPNATVEPDFIIDSLGDIGSILDK